MSTEQATSSPSTIQSIIDALADYTKVTGVDLSNNSFAELIERSNSLEAILELLQERENAFKEYRDGNPRLISCLRPSVTVIHSFSGILGGVVSLVPFQPASALFAGIDILLAAASGVSSSYDALLDLFECLGSFLKRLEIYTTIPPNAIMTEVIVKIMLELLSVLALASKQIKQGRFKKFAKKLLGESEIEAVLQRLDRLTQDEARMTVAQTLGVVHGLVANVKTVIEDGKTSTDSIRQDLVALHTILNEMNKMKRDQLQKDVQHWLSPPDPSKNHDFVWKAHHTGTSAWFFESKVLAEWKASGSFLWVHGKRRFSLFPTSACINGPLGRTAGSGKSTLLSAIIEEIEDMRTAGLASMAYYYFDFRDVKKQDRYGLLTSLVFQVAAELDSCHEVFSQLLSRHAGGARKPTSSALTKCMKDMLSLPGQGPIYIVIDALDECPNFPGRPSARDEVLELIEELVDLKLPNLHLCVASRPEMDIRTVLEPLTTLKVSLHDESGQKEDIIKYIESAVRSDRSMRRWKEEDKQLVVNVLSGKSDGMFRWAVCQIDRLCRTLPASIQRVLNDLPKTLDETYGRTLLGIDEEKREYALRLFQCLAVSIRPLSVEELAEILAVQFGEAESPIYNADWRPENAEEAVLSVCSSLVAVVDRGGHQVVQFSHFSVKEYLTSERLTSAEERFSYYHILPEPAHTILAHASLSVLIQLDDNIDRDTISQLPLVPYAARHWIDHAQFRSVYTHIQKAVRFLFDPTKPHFAAWIWLHDIDRHWIESMPTVHPTMPEAGPVYYASLCGLRGLVEHLIAAHSPDVNIRGGSHTTALHAASVKGHLEAASVLLRNGADPNSRDDLGRVPLHRVSQGGHLAMVESSLDIARLLVESGAKENVTDDEGSGPLHAAAQSGYCDIAKLLLGSVSNPDVRNKEQQTPLYMACKNGRLDVSRLLIDRGSDVNSRDIKGLTPLHLASRYGHVAVVQLLVDCGADVNTSEEGQWTPLHLASYKGHVDTAEFLIDRGANVDSRNLKQETPLSIASFYGQLDVARFLILKGSAVSAPDKEGDTPFHNAAYQGHLHITKFLLECGTDIDIRNQNGRTPLYWASQKGRLDVVRFLIEEGANIHIGGNDNSNSLHIASQNGHLDVVKLLIDAGTPVDVRNRTQKTPLSLASWKGKVEVARTLIHRGADPNVRDDQGQALLHVASQCGHLDMVRLYLDHQVDPNIKRNDLCSPLHLASVNGRLNVAELLVQRGAGVDVSNDKLETPLYGAVKNGNAVIARFLIDHGANVHTADSNGWTVLHAASQRGDLGVVKLLLRRGADVEAADKAGRTAAELASEGGQAEVAKFLSEYKANANTRNKVRSTTLDTVDYGADDDGKDEANVSLHAAADEGNMDTVKSLLERGTDVNARNSINETPLDRAAFKGNIDVVRLLIERGAEVDSRDNLGWTPLHESSRSGHLEVSQVLLDHGANVNARKKDYWTPLHISVGYGYLEIVKLLLERGADVHAVNREGQTPYQESLTLGQEEIADFLREHAGISSS